MTREELKAEALINLGSEPTPKEWEKLPCIKEQMPSCIGGEVSLQRFVGTDICAWFVGIGGLWEPQSEYFRVSLPPAEGAEKSCLSCRFHNSPTYHDKMWCRDCQQLSHYEQQPTAEGAEEILEKLEAYYDFKFHWVEKDRIIRAMTEFATLHAQRIAEKMVEERLREELMRYDQWLLANDMGQMFDDTMKCVDEYLKTRER